MTWEIERRRCEHEPLKSDGICDGKKSFINYSVADSAQIHIWLLHVEQEKGMQQRSILSTLLQLHRRAVVEGS